MGRKKKKPKRQKTRPNQKRRIAVTPEWVGGRLLAPAYITEDAPYRPEIIIWLELPDDLVVGSEMVDPNGPPMSFAASLLDAMAAPLVGRPRRPSRVRVADAGLATQVREAVPNLDVVVAPTPELDRIVHLMMASISQDGEHELSYFEGGRISVETVESLFQAARLLYGLSPWETAHENQVIRLDIPGLEVDIFPSLRAYDRFLDAADSGPPAEGPLYLGTSMLSLSFERGADLPTSMRREVSKQGWPVAGPKAYPWLRHVDRDGLLKPLTEKDVLIVSACATSLATFFLKHGRIFEREDFDPLCESYFDENDLEVRFTAPYEAGPLFATNDPPSARLPNTRKDKVGRNAPCPCGSGKKYKKCCLGKRDPEEKGLMAPAALHEMDQRLVEEMIGFAARRFGDARLKVTNDFDDPEAATQLLIPWAVYHFLIQGKPVVRWFAEEESERLSKTEIQWIEAQEASWLGLWEVITVEPGSHLTAKDLLTDEERTVQEIMGSKTLVKRDVFLGRIVDYDEVSVLCGLHPHPLPPAEGAQVVRRVRGRLRRKRAVPVDRLRDEKIGRYMIARWEETVLDLKQRRSIP
ncbi:MAG: YecA family protein, partial [Planctomycetota bacterium]